MPVLGMRMRRVTATAKGAAATYCTCVVRDCRGPLEAAAGGVHVLGDGDDRVGNAHLDAAPLVVRLGLAAEHEGEGMHDTLGLHVVGKDYGSATLRCKI